MKDLFRKEIVLRKNPIFSIENSSQSLAVKEQQFQHQDHHQIAKDPGHSRAIYQWKIST